MLDERETARYERELRAMLRRAGDEDPEGFAQIALLISAACEALPLAAEMTRQTHGYSWATLARPFGVTRQAMQQRFGVSMVPPPVPPYDVESAVAVELSKAIAAKVSVHA